MVLMINQKCGACNKSLTGGYRVNYSGIGQPFVECDRCGAINNNSAHVDEWKLMSSTDKLLFMFQHVFSILISNVMWLVIIAVALAVMDVFESDATLIISTATIYAILVGLGLLQFSNRLGKAIQASNVRMSNPEYVAKLERLGMVRKKI